MIVGSWSIAFFLVMAVCAPSEVYIDYGGGPPLFQYLQDKQDEYYLDIGAYDSIFASNTLNLYTKGWHGINIDANPHRLAAFNILRPSDTNIFTAIGDADKYLTLYDMSDDSSSTVI